MAHLSIEGLSVHAEGIRAPLVDKLSLNMEAGETLGIVGASGSGKSMTALAIMGLLPEAVAAEGSVMLDGVDLLELDDRAMSAVRGRRIAMIFQEPMTSLNPVHRVAHQIGESLALHRGIRGAAARQATTELLDQVQLQNAARRLDAYPHELSGGERQRVMIAMALASQPEILIADEPTTALDVTVQAEILKLMREIVAERNMSLLLITHDFGVISEMVADIMVMNEGRVVETGETSVILSHQTDPYTTRLIEAVPRLGEAHRSTPTTASSADIALDIEQVGCTYQLPRVSLFGPGPRLEAVKDATFQVSAGTSIGIVGESGSGKSTLARAIMALGDISAGRVTVLGTEPHRLKSRELIAHRPRIQMVFQDPYGSLDPRLKIFKIVAEPLDVTEPLLSKSERRLRVVAALESVGLEQAATDRYPHQFSGGQRQRIAIARALITNPEIVVADEPVSALDVLVQRQILELLARLQHDRQMTLILVSHDLAVVELICDEVIVMKNGEIVEKGPVHDVFTSPGHDYTKALLAAVPRLSIAPLS